jgi:shikimate kinase
MQQQRIFLIGPMGAGKTSVGRRLAQALGLRFVDSDHAIEERTGAAIPLIFEIEGEAGFRRRESAIIDELTQLDGIVLATGGGVVLAAENRAHLHGRGTVVYLQTTVEQQLARTRNDRNRPLLQTENPRARLLELMQIRAPLYLETAHIRVSTDSGNPRQVVREIVRQLEARPASAQN